MRGINIWLDQLYQYPNLLLYAGLVLIAVVLCYVGIYRLYLWEMNQNPLVYKIATEIHKRDYDKIYK